MWRKGDMDEQKKVDPEVKLAIEEGRANRTLSHLNASYISQVYNGHRQPSDELLEKLNLERQVTVTYVKKKRRWK